MIKFRLYYDKDKMTEYLNEMSRKGYALRGFFAGFLRFDRCRPGEYAYQVDITEGLFRLKDDYREFMQDMNVEIVCLWGFWAVLQKKAKDGPFVLYTDVESGIEHYSRIQRVFKKAVIVETLGLVLEVAAGLRGYALGWAGVFLLAYAQGAGKGQRYNCPVEGEKGRSGLPEEKRGDIGTDPAGPSAERNGFSAAGGFDEAAGRDLGNHGGASEFVGLFSASGSCGFRGRVPSHFAET